MLKFGCWIFGPRESKLKVGKQTCKGINILVSFNSKFITVQIWKSLGWHIFLNVWVLNETIYFLGRKCEYHNSKKKNLMKGDKMPSSENDSYIMVTLNNLNLIQSL